ncbi:MAG: BamA/TamA family outer membrane protein [candidate division KSB1 bacterium]|nr:BamA/TamA family outer membrane protein [candidate division KSB1 bacterium]MDZ7300969.1 BamA/TamA family outer membrane protein [candidate division KSB1 bacterium]MDZ7310353.1 BamA/TamA family outer membrane protein [candidate division KSB1 bacterium]
MLRKLVFSAGLLFLLVTASPAQFKIDRVSNDLAFEPSKTFTLYTNSHFNRVEALYLNLGMRLQPRLSKQPGTASLITLYGDLGYGFKNEKKKRPRWNTGLQKDFSIPNRLTIGAEYFYKVDTNDRWIVSELENSLAGIFLHEDFMDFFSKKGGRVFLDYQLAQIHTLRAEVGAHRYETLQRNSDWSLFGGGKDYPGNPRPSSFHAFGLEAGREVAVRLIAAFDWRDNPVFPNVGWQAESYVERTGNDFETNGMFLTVKRYQPTLSDQKLLAKVMFGTRSGSFAYQHLLTLGGLSSLRGYREKEFVGNRLLYANTTYVIGQSAFDGLLRKLPLRYLPFWEIISIGLFAETGYAWIADSDDKNAGIFDFGSFNLRDLRSDVGLALLVSDGLLRVDFAKRTDRGRDDWRVTFRILDKF